MNQGHSTGKHEPAFNWEGPKIWGPHRQDAHGHYDICCYRCCFEVAQRLHGLQTCPACRGAKERKGLLCGTCQGRGIVSIQEAAAYYEAHRNE